MPHQLETARLILRPFEASDADDAFAVLEGHPDVWRYDPGFRRTREQRANIIQKYIDSNYPEEEGTLAVVRRDGNVLMGYVGLQLYVLPREPYATPEVELYYKLGRDFWGQGYAAEACSAMITFAFTEMRLARIVTVTQTENQPSIALLKRLGMWLEDAPPSWAGKLTATLENNSGQ